VDERNLTGHYTFRLDVPSHREQLQVLLEEAKRDAGDCWRNETLDGTRFVCPPDGWTVPNAGVLDLDFVSLAAAPDAKDQIDPESFETLLRMVGRTISSSGRVDLVRQAAASFTFDSLQVQEILKCFFREIEKEEAFVRLESATGRSTCRRSCCGVSSERKSTASSAGWDCESCRTRTAPRGGTCLIWQRAQTGRR